MCVHRHCTQFSNTIITSIKSINWQFVWKCSNFSTVLLFFLYLKHFFILHCFIFFMTSKLSVDGRRQIYCMNWWRLWKKIVDSLIGLIFLKSWFLIGNLANSKNWKVVSLRLIKFGFSFCIINVTLNIEFLSFFKIFHVIPFFKMIHNTLCHVMKIFFYKHMKLKR